MLGEALPCNGIPVPQLSTVPSPSLPLPPVLPPCPALQSYTPVVSPSATPTARLPVQKPPEIETLVQYRECNIPLLVFVSQKSGLLPQRLPVEYACVCLGFFFISDMKVSFPLVILLLTFVDLPTGEEGRHNHRRPDTRFWPCALANYFGMGARRRGWVARRHQCEVPPVVDRPCRLCRRKRHWFSEDTLSPERSEQPVFQLSAIGPPGRFQAQ